MNRRAFLKFAGVLAAGLSVAPVTALCAPSKLRIIVDESKSIDWPKAELTRIGNRTGKSAVAFDPVEYKGEWVWVNIGGPPGGYFETTIEP